ncbi:MAG: hypothetical protein VKO21_08535 [Candidatus Sericytochromatia bacterium]|nr:hypothetical protein [Candidatus Sericytochromatia bacterium]
MKEISLLPVVALLASCASSTVATQVLVGKTRTATIAGYDRTHTRLFVNFIRQDAATERAIQKLPANYASASITLSNTAVPSLLASSLTRTVTFTTPTAPEVVSAASTTFTRLRVGSGYGVGVSFFNSGTLVGTGRRTGITLSAGPNTISIIISPTGDLAITNSSQGNTVGDNTGWFITKGDTVTFNTGFANDEHTKYVADNPGRTLTMRVLANDGLADDLTSGNVGTAERLVATASAPFNSFTWDTSVVSNTGFNPASDLTDSGTQASQLKFQIVDDLGAVVGESVLKPLSVGSAASLNLKLQ